MTLNYQLWRNLTNSQSEMSKLLPDDIWQHIGFRLPAADRIRFRAVCKTWMSLLPSRQPPWLMLAEESQDEEDPFLLNPAPPRRGFVCLGEQVIIEIDLPEIHQARCVGSSGNWLITAHNDKSIRLINPFSPNQIHHLPSQLEFENDINHDGDELSQIELWKVILSSSPSNGRNCVALAIHHYKRVISIARLGEDKWTTVQIIDPPATSVVYVEVVNRPVRFKVYVEVADAIFYKGNFYAITICGKLLVCDIGDGLNPPKASYLTGPMKPFTVYQLSYLVEWLGELLVVFKFIDHTDNGLAYKTSKFEIHKFDFINRKWNEVKSLGDYSLFLGFNTSVSVRASDYFGSVKRNCVYFTDDFVFGYVELGKVGGRDMGVFDLEDNSITPHFKGVSTSFCSPPVWIVPS